jgi:hypothetical protein
MNEGIPPTLHCNGSTLHLFFSPIRTTVLMHQPEVAACGNQYRHSNSEDLCADHCPFDTLDGHFISCLGTMGGPSAQCSVFGCSAVLETHIV